MTKVTYWTELSDYDIKTAEAMFESKRYLYVGFMAHQAIEKILKAYFVNIKSTPPSLFTQPFISSKAIRYLQEIFRRTKGFY